jgi:hypothetical protein
LVVLHRVEAGKLKLAQAPWVRSRGWRRRRIRQAREPLERLLRHAQRLLESQIAQEEVLLRHQPDQRDGMQPVPETSAFAGNGQSLAWIMRGSTDGVRTIAGRQRHRNCEPSTAVSA